MPVFAWEARTRTGEVKKGTMEAASGDAVVVRLKQQQLQPAKVKERGRQIRLPFVGRVSQKQLVVFTRQFATMIDAGLPLVQCLDALANQQDNRAFKKVLLEVKADVESGSTFADALRKHPRVFDELYVNLIHAGEVGGILDTILNRLAQYIEKSVKLKRMVRGAMVYPISILIVAIGVLIIMLTKVIPVFKGMFKDFGGGSLPGPTQFVLDASKLFISNWYIFVLAAVGLVVAFLAFIRNPRGREIFDAALLRIPIVGAVVRKVAVARFSRTLSTMLSSGVPILDALTIVGKTAGNKTIEAAIMNVREKISEGRTMAEPLAETGVFPPMVVQMIAVGESAGAMDAMLGKIADFYEEEVDVAVAALAALMEPMMLVFLGGLIGGVMISMYLPIFDMAGTVRGE